MRKYKRLTAAALMAALPWYVMAADPHGDHAHEAKATPVHDGDAKAEHGGVTAVAKDKTFELVVKADRVELHVHDHGNPVDISKSTATVSLLSSTDIRDVALKPAGERFEAKGKFKLTPGMKAIANITLNGESIPVRFELP